MRTVDELFAAYKAAYRSGEDADPRAYLEQAPEGDRPELAALIDGFLARAPAPAFDPAAFERFRAEPRAAQLAAAVEQVAEERLPALRNRAGVARDELVARLADALGVGGEKRRVHGYYHRMERGELEVEAVSPRVFDELGRLLGIAAERVRAAAARAAPSAPMATMARMAMPEPEYMADPAAPPAAAAPAHGEEPELDEVDRLFLGGG